MNCTVHSGIHTLSFSKPLTGKVYYRILHKAQKKGMQIETNTDYFDPSTTQTLLGYQKHGVVIYLSHPRPTIYKLKLRIEPERVLGNADPQALWRCEKGAWKRLVKAVDGLLGALDIPYAERDEAFYPGAYRESDLPSAGVCQSVHPDSEKRVSQRPL